MSDAFGPGNSLRSGYEHLRGSFATAANISIDGCTLALDTNAMLAFYRTHFSNAQNILGDMRRVQEQLFLPAQVQREFWLNRDRVLQQVRGQNSARELSDADKAVGRAIDAAAQWEIDAKTQSELQARVKAVFAEVKQAISGRSANDRATKAMIDPGSDVILGQLEDLFAGRVGMAYGADEMAQLASEAVRRFASRIPPGYMDAGKDDGGYGDYVLWRQLLDKAEQSRRPLVFVTNDTKEDWWRKLDNKTPINARFELVDEMHKHAGVTFATVTFEEFVTILSQHPGSTIEESALDDEGLETARLDVVQRQAWTVEEFSALVLRLTELGFGQHAIVMFAAAAAPRGVLKRARVLELLNLRRDAKLTGFTRPIRRVQEGLTADGVLGEGLGWALEAGYDGPGKAQRFVIPPEVAQVFADSADPTKAEAAEALARYTEGR